jgi:hypothetical protein
MKYYTLFTTMLYSVISLTQVNENFTDGNFHSSPKWAGSESLFKVNQYFELQTDAPNAGNTHLYTEHNFSNYNNLEWRIRAKLSFSPSSSNHAKFYLTADDSLPWACTNAVFILLGESGSQDAIRLYEKTNGIDRLLCSGPAGQIANSFEISIQVLRDENGLWSLGIDENAGDSYTIHDQEQEIQIPNGSYLIWSCLFTSSNSTKFHLDDIYAGPVILDLQAPKLNSIEITSSKNISLIFDENLDPISSQLVGNFNISPSTQILTSELDSLENKRINLDLSEALINGEHYDLFCTNIADLNGNDSSIQNVSFQYLFGEPAVFADIIISEVFPDPSPRISLPELEFIEIYNSSQKIISLQNWTISDPSSSGIVSKNYIFPGEYVTFCSPQNIDSFPNAIAVSSLPSLNNTGDHLVLRDPSGQIIDSLSYTSDWYHDTEKSSGGYTLERINPQLICSDRQNWTASQNSLGGTPGKQNSVYSTETQSNSLTINNFHQDEDNHLNLSFNHYLDSINLLNTLVSLDGTNIDTFRIIPSYFTNTVDLFLNKELPVSTEITVRIDNVSTCEGQTFSLMQRIILSESPKKGDIIINEILFNPTVDVVDYLELYNNSEKHLSLFGLEIRRLKSDNNYYTCSISDELKLSPHTYYVVCSDSLIVKNQYPYHGTSNFSETNLPSFPSDSATIQIVSNSIIIDQLSYSDKWHFSLLDDDEGKALERINPNRMANDSKNWHTAGENVFFGTPGLANSQFRSFENWGTVELEWPSFSPDNDGYKDVLLGTYKFETEGYVTSIELYDMQGFKVISLLSNELTPPSGTFTWDGTTDQNTKISIGQYLLIFSAYHSNNGSTFVKKLPVIVAGKL